MGLHLSISSDIVSTKNYDKRDTFGFEIVSFPFLDGGVPLSTPYGVYISQLIQFHRASSHVADFKARNKLLLRNFLNEAIGIINFVKLMQTKHLCVLIYISTKSAVGTVKHV